MLIPSATLSVLVLLCELLMSRESILVSGAAPYRRHDYPYSYSVSSLNENPQPHRIRHRGMESGQVSSVSGRWDRLLSRLDIPSSSRHSAEDPDDDWGHRLALDEEVQKAVAEYQGLHRPAKAKKPLKSANLVDGGSIYSRESFKQSFPSKLVDPDEEEDPERNNLNENGDDDKSGEHDVDILDDDENADEDLSEDKDSNDDLWNEWNNSESKEHMTEALSDSPTRSSDKTYSDHKWAEYSSRERLEHNRRHHNQHLTDSKNETKHIVDHLKKMLGDTWSCKIPTPQVVSVRDHYPTPNKNYSPHCTVLHKCSNTSGCCLSLNEVCQAKTTEEVILPFYIQTQTVDRGLTVKVEHLKFYNDTECHCRKIIPESRARPRQNHHFSHFRDDPTPTRRQRQARVIPHDDQTIIKVPPLPPHYHNPDCRCPESYSPRKLGNSCDCDCFDRQTECIRLKKGKQYFTFPDRLCIQTSKCKTPKCEFGEYLRLSGRCPKKSEADLAKARTSSYYPYSRRL